MGDCRFRVRKLPERHLRLLNHAATATEVEVIS